MQNLDQEWRELQERYEQMSDEELQLLANEAYELTDMAKELLQGEITRRGLKMQLLTEPPATGDVMPPIEDEDFDPESLDLIPGYQVWDMDEARRIKTICNDAGIPSFFGPNNEEDVEAIAPLLDADKSKGQQRGFEVGVTVKTPRADQHRMAAALRYANEQSPSSDADEPEPGDYVTQCPKCHSPEIVFEGLDGTAPGPTDANFKWHCEACGHTWSDDGVATRSA